MSGYYKIKNRAQLNAVILDSAISGCKEKRLVINFLRYSSGELSSALETKVSDARLAVETGYIAVNRTSCRSSKRMEMVTPELTASILELLAINGDKEYLFDKSMLANSNRAKSNTKIKHISRQAVWKWVSGARDAVISASRNSGLSCYSNLSPTSILRYSQGVAVTIEAIDNLITHHGSDISEDTLRMLNRDLGRLMSVE